MNQRPELTPRAILLGISLSAVMAAANVYLGLKVGMTVSASIPSAVLSMIILKGLRGSSSLENNLVQTAASAGESLAAGFIFTIPALLLLGIWVEVSYWQSVGVVMLGGTLGVLFSIPMRRLLIERENLTFPEGVATAEILMIGHEEQGGSVGNYGRTLGFAAVLAALTKVAETLFGLWRGVLEGAWWCGGEAGRGGLLYAGTYLSPALIGVGYIVGLPVAWAMMLGAFVSWGVGLPVLSSSFGFENAQLSAIEQSYSLWSKQLRHLGVGAMLLGGLWTLWHLRDDIVGSFSGLSFRRAKESNAEEDLPAGLRLMMLAFSIVASVVLLKWLGFNLINGIAATLILLVAAYLFSVVAGYMAGLVGSSNNPVSGITIATVVVAGLIIAWLAVGQEPLELKFITIVIGGVVCCAAALSGDNLQDLKAGSILGASPWKQQVMQILGVVAASFVLAPVLQVLHEGYVVGSRELVAPQAALVASLADGIFGGTLPLWIISVGALAALIVIAADKVLQHYSQYSIPVLAFAVGIYLPFALSAGVFMGALLRFSLERSRHPVDPQAGILFASGLITGEALVGVLLAFAATRGVSMELGYTSQWLGAGVFLSVLYLFRLAVLKK
jgi:putative OPT family oligopeptide transporter